MICIKSPRTPLTIPSGDCAASQISRRMHAWPSSPFLFTKQSRTNKYFFNWFELIDTTYASNWLSNMRYIRDLVQLLWTCAIASRLCCSCSRPSGRLYWRNTINSLREHFQNQSTKSKLSWFDWYFFQWPREIGSSWWYSICSRK